MRVSQVKNTLTGSGSGLQQSRNWLMLQGTVFLTPWQLAKKKTVLLVRSILHRSCQEKHTSTVGSRLIIVTAQQNLLNAWARRRRFVVLRSCEDRESQHKGREGTSKHLKNGWTRWGCECGRNKAGSFVGRCHLFIIVNNLPEQPQSELEVDGYSWWISSLDIFIYENITQEIKKKLTMIGRTYWPPKLPWGVSSVGFVW